MQTTPSEPLVNEVVKPAVLTFAALLPYKNALLGYLKSTPPKNKPSANTKSFIRKLFSPLVTLEPIPGQANEHHYHAVLQALSFDETGMHVWNVIACMFGQEQPRSLTEMLSNAFKNAERGLNSYERNQIKMVTLQSEQFESVTLEKPSLTEQPLSKKQKRLIEAVLLKEREDAAQRILNEQTALKAKLDAIQFEKDKSEFLPKLKKALSKNELTLRSFNGWAAKHLLFYAKKLTFSNAVKCHGLHVEAQTRLETENRILQKEAARLARAKAKEKDKVAIEAQTRRDWKASLLVSTGVMQHMNITETEYKRWLAEDKLKPTLIKEFSKWGKTLCMPLFDPVDLNTIRPESIAQWRTEHAATTRVNRQKSAIKAVAKAKKTIAIKKDIDLDNFSNTFSIARVLEREFHLNVGPTNSGKTHHAIEALIAAKTGVYLAPLRLLALENYERLKAAGIAVSLMTGEERIIAPNATHVCATIEMCDFTTAVHVAVIDEVQMLSDPQRGWAWVSAIVGVPAEVVYACGAAYSSKAVIELLHYTGETYTEHTMERLTPLTVQSNAIHINQVTAGDAVIAFSRKEVLNFAAMLKKRGLGVSVVYGALSPEVRRRQAQLFIDGTHQVVVATDAIGMGLNLPIKRVVFSASSKYDGVRQRELYAKEIQQIGGRAGRFGLHDEGLVTAFGADDLSVIRCYMNNGVEDICAPYAVMPTWLHIDTILKHTHQGNAYGMHVTKAMQIFARLNFKGLYQQADLTDTIDRLHIINEYSLSAKDAFSLAFAPADPKNDNDAAWLSDFSMVIANHKMLVVPMCPFNLGATPSSKYLVTAEAYSRELALYSWFACKYPEHASSEGLIEQRQDLAEFVDRCLLNHSTVFMAKKRKKYHWRDDDSYDLDDC